MVVPRTTPTRQGKLGAGGGDPIDDYLVFRSELRTALREGTPAALRTVIRRWAGPRDPQLGALIAQPDQMLVPIIRRMILEEPQLAELHDAARRWLIEHEPAPIRPRAIAPTDARRTPRPRQQG
jgi:hypothetical protein